MAKARSVKEILKAVDCPVLDLWKADGYWVLQYDNPALGIYETKSEMVNYLNSMTLEQWVDSAKAFIHKVETEYQENRV